MSLRKSKTPRKLPEKWTFLSLAFYNAPSLDTRNARPWVFFESHPPKFRGWSFAPLKCRGYGLTGFFRFWTGTLAVRSYPTKVDCRATCYGGNGVRESCNTRSSGVGSNLAVRGTNLAWAQGPRMCSWRGVSEEVFVSQERVPDLPFLDVWVCLGLFQPRKFLGVSSVFSCFSGSVGFLLGSRGAKILGGFPWLLPKHQGMEDQGCQASCRKRGWPLGKCGKPLGKFGELPGKSGKLPFKFPGLPLSSTARKLVRKSPKNFRGSWGNFRGSPGSLTPSQRLAKFVSKHSLSSSKSHGLAAIWRPLQWILLRFEEEFKSGKSKWGLWNRGLR